MSTVNPSTQVPIERSTVLADSSLLPILECSFEGIAVVEPHTWKIIYINPTLSQWLNAGSGFQSIGKISGVFSAADAESILDQIASAWHRDQLEITLHAQLVTSSADRKPVVLRPCRLAVADGLLGLVIHNDWDEAARLQPKPEHRDPLTGLPDRAFLLSRLAALMDAGHLRDRPFAVLFVDLDNFKQVNDSHGHLVGDRVLSIAARRLSDSVRDGDHVVRYGGDEFVLLVDGVTSQSDLEPIISRIHSALADVIALPEGDFTLKVSVGAAVASHEHRTPEDLLAAADRAMYAAKRLNS
jgi:diguanylate cyclase (GGDEF)-like protein